MFNISDVTIFDIIGVNICSNQIILETMEFDIRMNKFIPVFNCVYYILEMYRIFAIRIREYKGYFPNIYCKYL